MNDREQQIRETLQAVAESIHAPSVPLTEFDATRVVPQQAGSGRRPAVVALAAVLLVGGGVGAATGWDFWVAQVQQPDGDQMGGIEGSDLFAPDGLFACTDVLRLTPDQVLDLGRDRGFTEFRWQYEGRPEWPQERVPPDEVRILEVIPLSYDLLHVIVATPGSKFDSWDATYADRAVCDN